MKKVISAILTVLFIALCLSATICAEDEVIILSDVDPVSYTIYSGELGRDKSYVGGALIVAEAQYEKGISTHPVVNDVPSEIVYDISSYSDYDTFTAIAGKDKSTDLGSEANKDYLVVFYVLLDGVEVARSNPMTYGEKFDINVKTNGASKLTLGVIDCGVFAYLTSDFVEMKLTKTATTDPVTTDPGTKDEPSNPVTGDGTVAVILVCIAVPVLALTVIKTKKYYEK